MEAMLLAAMLSCSDGAWILSGLSSPNRPVMPLDQRNEVREAILEQMPDNCTPEQYDPQGRQ